MELSDHKVPIGVDLMTALEMMLLCQTLLVVILKHRLALYTSLKLIAYWTVQDLPHGLKCKINDQCHMFTF